MQTIDIIDAREVDGDPYEAAEAAIQEAGKALLATDKALEVAYILARNAGLQRQMDLGSDPDPAKWAATVEAGRIVSARKRVREVVQSLVPVRQAVAFNPKDAV